MKEDMFVLAQLDFTVGDLKGNYEKICTVYDKISHLPRLLVLPELSITGYTPEDLLLKQSFIDETTHYISLLAQRTKDKPCGMLLGGIMQEGHNLYNVAYLFSNGSNVGIVKKHHLPNYGVFDEKRYFTPGDGPQVLEYNGVKLLILICEDLWRFEKADSSFDIAIAINASPFEITKHEQRAACATNFVKNNNKPLLYLNTIGGQDHMTYDGGSFYMDAKSNIVFQSEFFKEQISSLDNTTTPQMGEEARIYNALILALRDYVRKSGFDKVIIGVSGGIDSALVASVCVDALGESNVIGVMIPSKYTSAESKEIARTLSKNLNIEYHSINLPEIMLGFETKDITEQNIQARTRGLILMAMSNEKSALLINTSNKSEFAVGYTTLYGDSIGAFAVIKDVYKTQVYKLAHWRNGNIPELSVYKKLGVIPNEAIIRAPSAELKHDQKDQDSLPSYEELDTILYHFIEKDLPLEKLKALNISHTTIDKVVRMVYGAEFKRRQGPIGPKISARMLTQERRYPVVNKFNF